MIIEEHLIALERGGEYSPKTLVLSTIWLQHFQDFCGERCPTKLRQQDLEKWQKELTWTPGPKGKLYAENTLSQAVRTIRRLYRWLYAVGKIETDLTLEFSAHTVKKGFRQKAYTVAEKRKLLASPDLDTPLGIRDRAILAVLLETEIPRAVCARLELGHICLDTAALFAKGRRQEIHALGTGLLGDLARYIREARPLLLCPGSKSQALFLNRQGQGITTNSIHQMWRQHRQFSDL